MLHMNTYPAFTLSYVEAMCQVLNYAVTMVTHNHGTDAEEIICTTWFCPVKVAWGFTLNNRLIKLRDLVSCNLNGLSINLINIAKI